MTRERGVRTRWVRVGSEGEVSSAGDAGSLQGRVVLGSGPGERLRGLTHQIGIVGTFDIANFGDLLFPMVADHELKQRLQSVRIRPFSYRGMDGTEWPYRVEPVADLSRVVDELSGLIVGGGHVIRFDKSVAAGYSSTSPDVHHPTGYWLSPTLLASLIGLPVIWNAVGVSRRRLDPWSQLLLEAALRSAAYASAREPEGAQFLRSLAHDLDVRVVPDTAFGLPHVLDLDTRSSQFERWCEEAGVDGPYMVVQPSPALARIGPAVRRSVQAALAAGIKVVELPKGTAALGDRPGLLDLPVDGVVSVEKWPTPTLMAEIVAHSQALVVRAFHLSIVGLTVGLPVFRPRPKPGTKYAQLSPFGRVFEIDEDGPGFADVLLTELGRRPLDVQVLECQEQLRTHWDRVAGLIENAGWTPEIAIQRRRWLMRLPGELETLTDGEGSSSSRSAEDGAGGALGPHGDLDQLAQWMDQLVPATRRVLESRRWRLADMLGRVSARTGRLLGRRSTSFAAPQVMRNVQEQYEEWRSSNSQN
jgi:hypothetical protein